MFSVKLNHTIPQIKTIRTSAYLLICTLFFSCAQIVAPGGGAKDVLSPKALKYSPDSAQLHFTSKSIEIEFDEFIQLKDLNNQLIISPLLEKTPEIKALKKTLTIEFDEKEVLKPNTTYCISFGNAIQDLHEGNPIENFKYIFSTGSFIDSTILKGKVQNGFNQSVEKGILVMLYSDLSDSIVFKSQPDYFAKTASDGTFQINNIKTGKYKLVAIKDANFNYKYDGEVESIGFVDAEVDVSKKQTILIDMFQEPAKKIFIKKYANDSYGKVTIIFNQGSDSILVQQLNNNQKSVDEFFEFSKQKDTLTYWVKNFNKDSLFLQVNNGNIIIDTLEFKMISKEDALKSKKNPLKLKVLSSPDGNQNFDLGNGIAILFNHPLSFVKNNSIILKEDTILFSKKYSDLGIQLLNNTAYIIKKDTLGKENALENIFKELKENTNYHLLIPPGTLTDFFGLTNDSIKVNFKTREEKYYGSVKLILTIPSPKGQYILQLLDESGNIIREEFVEKSQEINYSYLAPRKYKLKIIYDDNRNGKWDTGNYLKKIQPEKVIYNSELINIRSNWDADLEWKITN